MVVLLIILVFLGLFGLVCVECINLFELGLPPKDSDILEMLEKYSGEYELDRKWNDKFRLCRKSSKSIAPLIHQTGYSVIFPYYVADVGLVPIWYKSTKVIQQLFKDNMVKSKYKITTREKLGL